MAPTYPTPGLTQFYAAPYESGQQVAVPCGDPRVGGLEIRLCLRYWFPEWWVLEHGVVTTQQGRHEAHGVVHFGREHALCRSGGGRLSEGLEAGEKFVLYACDHLRGDALSKISMWCSGDCGAYLVFDAFLDTQQRSEEGSILKGFREGLDQNPLGWCEAFQHLVQTCRGGGEGSGADDVGSWEKSVGT